MYVLGLVFFIIHIVAFIAGGANSVVHPVLDGRLATATPDVRAALEGVIKALSRVGKYAMIALLLSGILTLWLKWDFVIPNAWFWVKMAGVIGMLVFIGLSESASKRAFAGDQQALARAKQFGMGTGVCFLVVIVAAVFAFN